MIPLNVGLVLQVELYLLSFLHLLQKLRLSHADCVAQDSVSVCELGLQEDSVSLVALNELFDAGYLHNYGPSMRVHEDPIPVFVK